jgi:hypothetical protein
VTGGTLLNANLVQWSLLARRAPILEHRTTFRPPPPVDLLSAAATPSIASFGFFFRGQHGSFDMAYASADLLTARPPQRPGRTTMGKVSFPQASLCGIRVVNGHREIMATNDLSCFGAGLFFYAGRFTDCSRKRARGLDGRIRGRADQAPRPNPAANGAGREGSW